MKSAYTWKPNSKISLDANRAGQHIEALQQRRSGQVTPKDILEDARSPQSPLHDAFQWDDGKAAEQFRLQQARHLLQSLVVEVKIRHGAPATPMRAFVNVERLGESTYVGLQTAMSDKDLRAQVIDAAWRELTSWRDRHQQYSELAQMVSAIDHATRFRDGEAAA